MLDIEFATFYLEMNGHNHKVQKRAKKLTTNLKHTQKKKCITVFTIFHQVITWSKACLSFPKLQVQVSVLSQ